MAEAALVISIFCLIVILGLGGLVVAIIAFEWP